MAFGSAYRLDQPGEQFLNIYSAPRACITSALRLYRARCQTQQPPPPPPRYQPPPSSQPLWNLLPPEIVRLILLSLDMITLDTIRLVNTTIQQQVDSSLFEYSLLRTHAVPTLKVLDLTQCTHHFSIQQLYHEFSHPQCRTCSDFGPYLYLPTLSRACFQCIMNHYRDQVTSFEHVLQIYRLRLADCHHLPVVYPFMNLRDNRPVPPVLLVDVAQAEALHLQHGGGGLPRLPWGGLSSAGPRSRQPSFPQQALPVVAFPYWDPRARVAESGVYCYGCTLFWENGRAQGWGDLHNWADYCAWIARRKASWTEGLAARSGSRICSSTSARVRMWSSGIGWENGRIGSIGRSGGSFVCRFRARARL
ncbi:hypothetical protein BO86DRAFT_235282 [Aspergillus japonicus CBS 114.51]|uniref:F-box domain-containing protein n=1 Tax=Aspergillus japonicus CBS 114.51 TaxID=1448312 RepID=A0A8T8WMR8_ASPJA|nr:hypothetical protein BO86DRAFT_235282 [Aspergillus japonicus CBS 114.51]RAH76984.1 hypothetical protein BO86DRAFT_235282 [Aspergillus japonicus CBS 114.51]